MVTVPNIIIVADKNDFGAARLLIDKLASRYSMSGALWKSKMYFDNEFRITGKQAVISIGGPEYNPVTKVMIPLMEKKNIDNDTISVQCGFNKCVVYGKHEIPSTLKATKYFIDNLLAKYVDGLLGS